MDRTWHLYKTQPIIHHVDKYSEQMDNYIAMRNVHMKQMMTGVKVIAEPIL